MPNIEDITSQIREIAKKGRKDSLKSPMLALRNLPNDRQMKELKEAVRDLARVSTQILQAVIKETEEIRSGYSKKGGIKL